MKPLNYTKKIKIIKFGLKCSDAMAENTRTQPFTKFRSLVEEDEAIVTIWERKSGSLHLIFCSKHLLKK